MNLFDTSRQIPLFLSFVLVGAYLGIIYDLLYIFRRRYTVVTDTIFCVAFTLLFGVSAYVLNSGSVHLYFFIGTFVGITVHQLTLGKIFKKYMDILAEKIYNLYVRIKMVRSRKNDGKKEKEKF